MKSAITIITVLVLGIGSAFAQVDEKKMNRDLEIANKIISTLVSEESGNSMRFGGGGNFKYIPNYGAILHVPLNNVVLIRTRHNNANYNVKSYSGLVVEGTTVVDIDTDEDHEHTVGYSYKVKDKNVEKKEKKVKKEKKKDHDNDHDVEIIEIQERTEGETRSPKVYGGRTFYADVAYPNNEKQKDSIRQVNEKLFKKAALTFYKDYAGLIGQLKPEERIVLSTSGVEFNEPYRYGRRSQNALSSFVLKSDVDAYTEGKLSEKEFESKIKFESGPGKKAKDLGLFGGIFSKLYSSDFSETYYSDRSEVFYEWYEEVGAQFYMKVYSSVRYDDYYHLLTTGKKVKTEKERDDIVKSLYAPFVQSIKENILNYGKTIKSLEDNDFLTMKINLTKCNCDIPKEIEVKIKMKDIRDFASGSLSEQNAMKKFIVKEK